jgi:hypothetical protein
MRQFLASGNVALRKNLESILVEIADHIGIRGALLVRVVLYFIGKSAISNPC